MNDIGALLPILLPLLAIQVVLMVLALMDLARPERRVRGGSKAVWAVVVIIVNTIGPLAYFLFGREEA